MKTYSVVPHEGIGPIRFGMTRDESHAAMAMDFHSFLKGNVSDPPTNAYLEASFQVFFDANDQVEYIELSRGTKLEALFNGASIFETEAEELVRFISKIAAFDADRPDLGTSYIFPALELALWRPTMPENDADEEGRYFSTIGVGKRGYFS